MARARVFLSQTIRSYFAEIGKRGGEASQRELTGQQARRMVVIREAKRAAKKKGKPAPKLRSKQQHVLRRRKKSR